jgi:hypothetical protein
MPRAAIFANLNTNMFLTFFPLKTLMVLGLDESDFGTSVRAVERNRFVRSDQYSFIREGIPALAMKVADFENTPEAEVARKWTGARYDAVSDDLHQPIDLGAADKFVNVVRTLAVGIANRADTPKWNATSFFKLFAKH